MLRNYLLLLAGWIVLVAGSLIWNLRQIERNTLNDVATIARARIAKDIEFRDWATSHGGVYVQPSSHTPPNPYLKVPDRDVVTTTGMKLTLMNPAYVIREIQDDFNGDKKDLSHLTSLKLLNPDNKPDAWEIRALKSFEQGKKEMLEVTDIGDKPYLRLMQSLPVSQGCLKCHAIQGYKAGDIRGGIGAYVLLTPFMDAQLTRTRELSFSHGLIWLIGCLGLGIAYRRERSIMTERNQVEKLGKFRTRILEMLASDDTLDNILKAIVLCVENVNPVMICSILLLDKDGLRLGRGIAPSLPDFYNEAIEGIEIGKGVGSCGTAAFTGERVVVDNIRTHPDCAPYRALAARANLAACWSQPILSATGSVLGTFAIYYRQPHPPSDADIRLIEQSASLASVAIEKKRATEDLIVSEQRFHSFFESNASVMLLIDPENGKIEDANQSATVYYGYPRTRLIGMKISEINTLSQECIAENTRKALHKERGHFLFQHRLASGEMRDVEVHSTPVETAGRLMLFSIIHDITDKKQAEARLALSSSVFTHASEAIMITSPDGTILEVNEAFSTITGYSREEVTGHNPRILKSGRQRREFYAAMWLNLIEHGVHYGEILNKRKNGEVYAEMQNISAVRDEHGNVQHYVALFSDITDRKQAEIEIHNLAFYDGLTGLPNRRLLMDRIKSSLSASSNHHLYGAVLFIDLDSFKTLNDTQGHEYGDLLLVEVAQRIKACVSEGDTTARIGGDDFVVLLNALDEHPEKATQKASVIAEKIRSSLTTPYLLENTEYAISTSIGVVLYCGSEVSAVDLFKYAEMAVYNAKESGRNTVRFFDTAMQLAIETRAALESDLRHAVPNQQLQLYYQIQVDNDQRVLGAEVLVRWLHPVRGMVYPAQFIPVAEECSLILEIGWWVLDMACRQLVAWSTCESTLHLTLAVNVSAQQFRETDFVEKVAAVMNRHRIVASRLKLELTESVILTDVSDVIRKMHGLKGLGIKLSMDDFGTGYSSLSYLKQLPLDQIKIDQSFVRDMTSDSSDAVMVQTIIDMAKNFRLNVIAEGVETKAQLLLLQKLGCMAYQGYYFGEPMPVEQFEARL